MRSLVGHRKDVRAIAFTPAGRLVSGGSDGTIRLWDAGSGEAVWSRSTRAPVYAVAASPDGAHIAHAGRAPPGAEANAVTVLNPTGISIHRLEVRTHSRVGRIDPVSRAFVTEVVAAPRSIWSLGYSADGEELGAVCRVLGAANILNGGGGWVWQARSRRQEGALAEEDAYCLALAPVGRRLAVASHQRVRFYDRPLGEPGPVYPLTAWPASVAFIPGTDQAVAASNSFLFFLDASRQARPTRVKTGARTVTAVAASPDGRWVLAGGKPGIVEVYDAGAKARAQAYDFAVGGVHALAVAPDGLTFAVAGDKGLLLCDMPG